MVPAGHDEPEAAASPTALVVPVGGTPEAPLAAIREVKPHFVAYVVSAQTRPIVDQIEAQLGTPVPKAREILLSDPQDLTATFREIQAKLPSILREWNLGWDALCVNLTGGTKVMTAALALATSTGRTATSMSAAPSARRKVSARSPLAPSSPSSRSTRGRSWPSTN
ncbi:MAG TPA: hypothetical protein VJU18_13135 [Vicinamibacteria bacterium]|nr:hypothetical protein [Vicinamibacteria bacterium]